MSEFHFSNTLAKKQSDLIDRLRCRQYQTNFSPDETNFSAVSNGTAASSSHACSSQFKKPILPPWQQKQQHHSQLNCTIGQSSLKCMTDSLKNSFLTSFEHTNQRQNNLKFMTDSLKNSFLTSLENTSQMCTHEQLLPMYTFLNSYITNYCSNILLSNKANASSTSNSFVDPTRDYSQRSAPQQTEYSSCVKSIPVRVTQSEFSQLNEDQHSTQINIPLDSPNNDYTETLNSNIPDHSVRPSSSASNYSSRNQPHTKPDPAGSRQSKNTNKFSTHFFDSYVTLGSKVGPSTSKTAAENAKQDLIQYPLTRSDKKNLFKNGIFSSDENRSPNLNRLKAVSSSRNSSMMKKPPKINTSRIKSSILEHSRMNNTISGEGTKIKNWTLKRRGETSHIELFGCIIENDGSSRSTPKSVGTVVSKRHDNLIKTKKGVFQLVGPLHASRELPAMVKTCFKTKFPQKWRKIINDSGMLG